MGVVLAHDITRIVPGEFIGKGLIKDEFDRYVASKIIAYGSDCRKKSSSPTTIFDLLLPRIIAGEQIKKKRNRGNGARWALHGLRDMSFSGLPFRQINYIAPPPDYRNSHYQCTLAMRTCIWFPNTTVFIISCISNELNYCRKVVLWVR
jgi:hypothetical protein